MKGILMTAFAAIFATSAFAQTNNNNFRVGIKGGVNMAKADFTSPIGTDYKGKNKVGYYGGLMGELSFPKGSKFKLQGEALYNYLNFKNEYSTTAINYNNETMLNQLSVPVFLKYFVTPAFSLNAGLSANFNLSAKSKLTQTDKTTNAAVSSSVDWNKDNVNTVQTGALLGAEYYLHKGFFVDARYNRYFSSPYKATVAGDKTDYKGLGNFQIGLGYKF